jgi:ankyrin repeat protein
MAAASTPLDFAPRHRHRNGPRVAQLLVAHGADTNIQGSNGFMPLHRPSMNGTVELGANVKANDDDKKRKEVINLRSKLVAK